MPEGLPTKKQVDLEVETGFGVESRGEGTKHEKPGPTPSKRRADRLIDEMRDGAVPLLSATEVLEGRDIDRVNDELNRFPELADSMDAQIDQHLSGRKQSH